jgi:succinate-semialdehyde dehydrogenase / glutarate-semialdehyde dehydrogenase
MGLEPARQQLLSHITLSAEAHEEISVRAPFTGEVFGMVPAAQQADVELAVARARAAQPAWAARSFAERSRIFLRFHDLLLARQKEVLNLIQLETGKARRHAFEEVLDSAVVCRYYARHAKNLLRPHRRQGAFPVLTKTWEVRVPYGVVGCIVPWNYPLNLAVTDAAAALMAGNAVVLKPDHQTTFTALWAIALLREAGLPPEVLQVVTGEGALVGPMLIDRVDYVMFTGSTRTGKLVARPAADRLIGCSLELGGKNPMIVLADADLEAAVEGAIRGCFSGAGQLCISIERIYVDASKFDAFVSRFAARAQSLKLGAALDFSIEMGSLTSQRQLDTVEDHVRDAVSKGATLQCGGRRRPALGPLFYEPTILTKVNESMKLYADETFGPVVAVYPFAGVEEAVERANATRYGLNASIWTRNAAAALRLAKRIRSGSVNINEAYTATWGSVDAPVGGMKESGLGCRHGAEGILKFTEPQTIAAQRLMPLGLPPGDGAAARARLLTWLVKLVRYLGV